LRRPDWFQQASVSAKGRSQVRLVENGANDYRSIAQAGVGFETLQQFPAIQITHHHVQDYQVGVELRQQIESIVASRDADQFVALPGQVAREQSDHILVVFHYGDNGLFFAGRQGDGKDEVLISLFFPNLGPLAGGQGDDCLRQP